MLLLNSVASYCYTPVNIDPYDRCDYMCRYCFACKKKQNGAAQPANSVQFKNLLDDKIFPEYTRARVPIAIGTNVDPLPHAEKKYGEFLKWLRYAHQKNYPLAITTKGASNYIDTPEYAEALCGRKNLLIKTSIMSLNEDYQKRLEPAAPSSAERLRAISIMAKSGTRCIVRLRPYVPGMTKWHIDELLDRIRDSGAVGVNCRMLYWCTIGEFKNNMKNETDLYERYYAKRKGAFKREFSIAEERAVLKDLKERVEKRGLLFGADRVGCKDLSTGKWCCMFPEDWNIENTTDFGYYNIIRERGRVNIADLPELKCGNITCGELGCDCAGAKARQKTINMKFKDRVKAQALTNLLRYYNVRREGDTICENR